MFIGGVCYIKFIQMKTCKVNTSLLGQCERESGEKPERSGHCKQGFWFMNPLRYFREKENQEAICESGNLLICYK